MKGFLIDQNLPRVPSLPTSLPLVHALEIGPRPSDAELWEQAKLNDLVIVTKDADFSERIVMAQPPPRVIHLRVGNMRRADFVVWLTNVWPQLEALVGANKLVNAYRDRIEAVE